MEIIESVPKFEHKFWYGEMKCFLSIEVKLEGGRRFTASSEGSSFSPSKESEKAKLKALNKARISCMYFILEDLKKRSTELMKELETTTKSTNELIDKIRFIFREIDK